MEWKIRKYCEWKIHQLEAKVNGQMQLLFFPERTFTFRKLHLSHSILHSLGVMMMLKMIADIYIFDKYGNFWTSKYILEATKASIS